VSDHKTSHIHGSAKIILQRTVYSWLKLYVSHFRNQLLFSSLEASERLFLSWNGHAMTSSQINQAIQTIWRQANLSRITPTLVRKSAVSAVHRLLPDQKDGLAELMAHRVATADRFYKISERNRTSVAASKNLSLVMSCKEQQSYVPEPKTADQKNEISEYLPHDSVADRVDRLFVDNSSESDIIPPSSTAHKLFDDENTKYLAHKWKDIIENGHLTQKLMREALSNDEPGKQILGKYSNYQLMNKLKYERRRYLLSQK
jgi:hypothetical protein